MKRKMTVSIGIPAYNEEANIHHLLTCLIYQSETGIEIKEIMIVNDGSQDDTAQEVRKVHDKRILLVNNASRKGQIFCQNLIFSRANSDIIVLLEADTEPINLNYIKTLVEPIKNDRTVGIVQGNIVFAKPKTFIGRVLHLQTSIFHRAITRGKNLGGIFSSGRGGRAFSRQVYAQLRWPIHVPEDTFAALWCIRRKIPIQVQKRAVYVFRIPENITDFRHARQKMVTGRIALEKYFSIKDIRAIYGSGDESKVKMSIEFMLTNPLYCAVYFFLKIYAEIVGFNRYFSDYWEIGRSTKFVLEEGRWKLGKSLTISSITTRL